MKNLTKKIEKKLTIEQIIKNNNKKVDKIKAAANQALNDVFLLKMKNLRKHQNLVKKC